MVRSDNPIDALCRQLVHEVKVDENRKPEERTTYTATVVGDEKAGCYIVIEGSAHKMEGCFIELFKRRPELRKVVHDVLGRMYQIENR